MSLCATLFFFLPMPGALTEPTMDPLPSDFQGIWKPIRITYSATNSENKERTTRVECDDRAFAILNNCLIDIYDTAHFDSCIQSARIGWKTLTLQNGKAYLLLEPDRDEIQNTLRRRVTMEVLKQDQLQVLFEIVRPDGHKNASEVCSQT